MKRWPSFLLTIFFILSAATAMYVAIEVPDLGWPVRLLFVIVGLMAYGITAMLLAMP